MPLATWVLEGAGAAAKGQKRGQLWAAGGRDSGHWEGEASGCCPNLSVKVVFGVISLHIDRIILNCFLKVKITKQDVSNWGIRVCTSKSDYVSMHYEISDFTIS